MMRSLLRRILPQRAHQTTHRFPGRRAAQTRRRLLLQLLDGLCHLHSLGILHCKLRPASVLINSHGVLKLSGLGLGRVTSTATTRQDSRQAAREAMRARVIERRGQRGQ